MFVAVVALVNAGSGDKHHDVVVAGSSAAPTPSAAAVTPTGDSPVFATSSTASSPPPTSGSASNAAPSTSRRSGSGTALLLLDHIATKGRAPLTGYDRDQFGSAWTDDNESPDGHNGCDTRNDILRRDLTDITLKPDTGGCAVLTGTLHDPYTGRKIAFQRGVTTSADVQIDHVVALGDAWQTGAQRWDATTRTEFANDPLELLAVDGPANESKGDADAASWLPPSKTYRCAYVARQVAVKARYGLWMTPAEHAASTSILAGCPTQAEPTETPSAQISAAPHETPTSTRPADTTSSTASDVFYANCSAVRAAGAAPLLRGQPGYSSRLDRDGDGVACED